MMTGIEGFIIFVIALCILYLLSYFIFFRRRVQIKDDETTPLTDTTTRRFANKVPKFKGSDTNGNKTNNEIMIVEPSYEVDDFGNDLSDVEMISEPKTPISPTMMRAITTNDINDVDMLSEPKTPISPTATADAITKTTVDAITTTTVDVSGISNSTKITTLPEDDNALSKPITINHAILRKTKGVLETFVCIEKRQALYDDIPFVYPKTLDKINKTGTLEDPLCYGKTQLNQWDVNSTTLRNVVHSMMLAMAIDLDNKRPYNNGIMIFMLKFINKFTKTYRKNERPWGEDDFGFIDMMYLLMIFMISPNTKDAQRQSCAKIILRVITRPGFAFGQRLPTTNIAHTSTPFILAKLLMNSKLLKHDINRVKKAILREYSEIPNSGFHHDRSYSMSGAFNVDIPNILCAKYKYELLVVAIKDLLGIDKSPTFTSATDDLNEIVIHPTIKLGIYGISTFIMANAKLNSTLVYRAPEDNYGLAVMPLARVLRLFTKRHCFAVRGMVDGVKYMPEAELTENGQTIPRNQFYAMQIRKPLSDRETRLTYPEFGCLVWDNKDEVSSMECISIRQARSYVGMYDDTGVFYQSYTLHDPTESTSVYSAEELIVIQSKANEKILDFNIKITNSSSTRDLTYYGYNDANTTTNNSTEQYYAYDVNLTIPRLGGIKTFNTKLRIKSDTNVLEMIEPTREININAFSYPIKLSDSVSVVRHDDNDGYALIELPNKEPRVYSTSSGLSIAHKDFSYDATTNQWVINKNTVR